MGRFVVGTERDQPRLFPPWPDDWIAEDNPVSMVNGFVNALDLGALGFAGVDAARTGRPGCHLPALLKLYVYGYLNRVPSSRRLEREVGCNVVVMWLTGQLSPDHKTIAEFRHQNGSDGEIGGMRCSPNGAQSPNRRPKTETLEQVAARNVPSPIARYRPELYFFRRFSKI